MTSKPNSDASTEQPGNIVFISYSHDSDAHCEKVLGLSERLRADGIETVLDQYVNGAPEQGWPRWMLDQLDAADTVLVVCTETYYRRLRGHEKHSKGKGVDWEGALITQEIYDSRSRTSKFVPVFLSEAVEDWIPEPLRSTNHYALTSESAYQSLYDLLLGQAGVEAQALGTLKPRTRRKGTPLTFGESSPQQRPLDISRIDKYAPAELIGREDETKLLSDAWDKAVRGELGRPHVLTFVALGGEGKTALVAKWAAGLAFEDWPGCDVALAWSFYSQGTREQVAASSDVFLKEALTIFGDPEMAASAQGAFEKGRRLAQLVGQRRALLILDGLEPLQYAPTSPTPGELKDQGIQALLRALAASSRGLCVVTTRYSLPGLRAYWQTTAPETKLLRLSRQAGVALLKTLGVTTGAKKEFEKLVEDVNGHALTLQIMGAFLRKAFHGDIRCRDRVRFEKADAKVQGGHAFRAMAAYVQWIQDESEEAQRELAILRLLGLFDRPATSDCINALLQSPSISGLTESLSGLAEEDWNLSLDALETTKLLTVHRDTAGPLLALDAHPLLREYFARELRRENKDAWQGAHKRLYEHLCATTKEGDEPTLEDLQPLYQAVAHGCHAGLQQEACVKVYRDRILRGTGSDGFYSTSKLGAFGSDLGAVVCFFETPWSRVSPALTEPAQAWMLAVAVFDLRALGRLTEALEPMRAGLPIELKREDWINAATSASNLSELELTLGDVAGAMDDAEQSVIYAERSGDAFHRYSARTTHADALHQAGRTADAEARFREAEQMQTKDSPQYALLYSLRGFLYCDLLLTEVERGAWQLTLDSGTADFPLLTSCRAVGQRAAQTLTWAELNKSDIISAVLDHLTLGRVVLYRAILEKSAIQDPKSAIEDAVDGLRRAGRSDHLPRGLLTRAWLRFLEQDPAGSAGDLDEAWEIAERGSMKLFMADVHLYRARLFGPTKEYPWDSPQADLDDAARLIKETGYHRRDEELADAREAAKNWT